jgi:hypothetical protein
MLFGFEGKEEKKGRKRFSERHFDEESPFDSLA